MFMGKWIGCLMNWVLINYENKRHSYHWRFKAIHSSSNTGH
ncbi:hypothetical protein [Moraxella lacunata]